ncbi:CHAT domain-containing protein [Lutibacter citreus]|uniref:CHAT domain-containing protein n=1 Tax=Lutibacter citreus TaxID=2138210 RepID=UPI0013003D52|nr:CHAT domain-containing tetratricopeptide repeat protein [Lutibacter citreus]
MRKKWVVLLLLLNVIFSVAQQLNNSFQLQVDNLKSQDNYSEYIYAHLDEFVINPSVENLKIFKNLETGLWRDANSSKESVAKLYFYINYAFQLKQFGFINQSIDYYEKAYSFYKNNNINYDIIEFCLKPLANNYTRLGDVERAEDILKVSIENSIKNNRKDQLGASYLNLAAAYRVKGQFNQAIKLLKEAVSAINSAEQKAKINSDLAINYLLLKDFENCKKYISISNKINKNKDVSVTIRNANTLGGCYLNKGIFDIALSEFEVALEYSKKYYSSNNREIAKILNQIGEVYRLQNNLENALRNYQKAIEILLPNYKPSTIYENPKTVYFYPENTLKVAFDGRAKVLASFGEFSEALQNYQLSFLIEDELRSTYLNQNSKLLQQQENRKRSEDCIELCYALYKESGNISWVEKAFYFSEETKSRVLLENKELSLSKSDFSGDTLFVKEKILLLKKAQLNTKIALGQLKGNKANIQNLTTLTAEREAISNKFQLLQQKIDFKYPSLKSVKKKVSLNKILNEVLLEDQLLMEFFEGDTYFYMFSVSQNKQISMLRIEKSTEFVNQITKFIALFSDERGSAIQNNIKEYRVLAHKIYTKLFPNKVPGNILLIPDGIFSFIPFDALLTEKSEITNFEKLPYFLKTSNISYAYSATILLNDLKFRYNEQQKLLGFFPVFKNNHRGLAELSYTEQEAKSIEREIDGEFLLYKDASKELFNKLNKEYSILHLSTHATAGGYNSLPSIEFYNNTLFLSEIYGYKLNLDLVVLSACETGIGKLRKGEGAMSLARGFSFAGVKNLVVSLWKVNDKSTEKLMSGFYKNLRKVSSKETALYLSKLDYLKDKNISNSKKSPYYWASFIYMGEISPVKESNYTYYWLLFFVLIVFSGYYFLKKK